MDYLQINDYEEESGWMPDELDDEPDFWTDDWGEEDEYIGSF